MTRFLNYQNNAKRFSGLSRIQRIRNNEIAEQLDISPKTVEKHLTKALKFMREELKDYLPLLLILLK